MWENNDKILSLIEKFDRKSTELPLKCPVCEKDEGHLFFHRFSEEDTAGAAWAWCSSCKSYSHLRYLLPEWWTNCSDLDEGLLCDDPEYLESKKEKIDSHIKSFIV